MTKARLLVLPLLGLLAWGKASAQPPLAAPPTSSPIALDGVFESKDPGSAENVSGIACTRPRSDGRRACVVVDDEAGFAQRATLDGETLRVGARIPILTRVDDPSIVGGRPTGLGCTAHTNKFTQLDGEGVAFQETAPDASGFFYVSGSHGCSRSTGEDRPSQFVLARVAYDAASDTLGEVVRTWRLSEALRTATTLGPRFGRPLDNAGGNGGLDIEGIAVDRGRLLVGFRAPNVGGMAYILPVPLDGLFAREGTVVPERPIELRLGEREGIRDLASMPDGRVLVLTGPAPNLAEVQSRILAVNRHAPEPVNGTWVPRKADLRIRRLDVEPWRRKGSLLRAGSQAPPRLGHGDARR